VKRLVPIFVVAFSILFGLHGSSFAQPEDIVFIVNMENPISSLKTAEVRDFYFKRKRNWPDGSGVRFIDRSSGSGVRQTFIRKYLGKKSDEIDMFWIGQKLYSGDAAPLQEPSDTLAIRFVETFKGAIGYVSSTTDLTDRRVKVVTVEN
jgi:ABC-type phosphate transport system substrate-binding protein